MSTKTAIIASFILIIIGVLARLLLHIPNATPITAIALFGVAYLGFRNASFVLLATMAVTDTLIGFYQWQIMLAVYGSFMLALVIGLFVRKNKSWPVIFMCTITSSILFFLITNWAVWQFGFMYEHSFSGLTTAYAMGIPFFRNSLIGDLFYTGLLFGSFQFCLYIFDLKYLKLNTVSHYQDFNN